MYRLFTISGAMMIDMKKTKKARETVQFGRIIDRSTVEIDMSATTVSYTHLTLPTKA